jgi:DNA polymerase III subunit gamma/tau
MVFYRKYRPQSLDDLIGQDHIKLTLSKAFTTGKLAHAYLFCGPRGCGKTSTARILAKMVNCQVGDGTLGVGGGEKKQSTRQAPQPTAIPCNRCSSCLSITDGSNLDLIEIDAASNRGIDDIRDLRERIKLSPTSSKMKVYIIDEVHMLTTEAFNALLKTLEEPPSHVLFILATTEAHKVPQTILSRVQRLDFKLATPDALITALGKIVKEEKLEVEDDALRLIAKYGEGSFRDSEKILDQLASANGKITLKIVEKAVNSGGFSEKVAILRSIAKSDSQAALQLIHKQIEGGVNIKEFTTSNLEILRLILLLKGGALQVVKDDLGSINFEIVSNLALEYGSRKILNTIKAFSESLEKLKYATIQSLPLEVAVVESCIEEEVSRVSQVPRVSQGEESKNIINASTDSNNNSRVTLSQNSTLKDDQVEIPMGRSSSEVALLKDRWNYILETIRPDNYSLEAMLKQAKLLGFEGGAVILEVPYAFHQRILEAPRSRTLLESVISDVLGKPAKVITKLGKRPVRVEELANVEVAQDDEIVRIAAEIFNS